MYIKRVKTKKTGKNKSQRETVWDEDLPTGQPQMMKDAALAIEPEEEAMVRTQIYLSKAELEFVQREAARRGLPMAAVIRRYIDEKMEAPDNAWSQNPMLAPSVEDPAWEGHEDGAINHDHYIYGSPKKFVKDRGQWVAAPELPEDYYDNPARGAASDAKMKRGK